MEFCKLYGRDGVWIWFDHGNGGGWQVLMIANTPEKVARKQSGSGYGKVGFWPINTELDEAVDWWMGLET